MVKRFFDIICSILGLLLCLPFILGIVILVYVKMPGKIIFQQIRVGKNSKCFLMYKIRTMMESYDKKGQLLPDEKRLTPLGSVLRKLSLDELPELWNVLRGDMSFVGPRPLLPEYLPLYDSVQARRHEVRPGITGWAQVNGRNAISWEERFKLDVWYVDHQNFWLDMKILCKTIVHLFQRKGINAEGHVTMPKFTGSNIRGSHET